MLRTSSSRPLFGSVVRASRTAARRSTTARPATTPLAATVRHRSQVQMFAVTRLFPRVATAAAWPPRLHQGVAAYSSDRPPVKLEIDRASERETAKKKLEARPGEVTTESSVRHVSEPYETPRQQPPVVESVKTDVNTIKEALAWKAVPRESYIVGLGGTVPYLVTSLTTVYLGWNLRHTYPTSSALGNSFMVSQETAQHWLSVIEPLQLGYGAVIISFLGAIHWGMEYMEKSPSPQRTRFRYAMGVLSPAVAWPTLFLPVHFALTGQFLAFVLLYFADSRATSLGWAPPWYATYRFVLTFIVGVAIMISLIFRAKVDSSGSDMTQRLEEGLHRRGQREEEYTAKWASLEKQEKEKRKKEEQEAKKQEKKKKDEEEAEKKEEEGSKANEKEGGVADKENEEEGDRGQTTDRGDERGHRNENEGRDISGDTTSKKKAIPGDKSQ
ncbi:hypothetical protein SPI_06879 [Niveomyces insectorum RCEF 264]|uniref:Mitochondrial inner membrane protein 1 n=1 Tax=Niveomyces insectorum RCEF 264 TaxID=1081102 RepID=A0A167QV21_9HYPO|nr:hypothetical protein SPI_06879 [Niveomyces insectorum RCEF 264]